MATTSPVGIYYRTQAEARPTDEAMALSLANSVNNAIGLVPIVPTGIAVASGTGTVSATGQVNINGATSVKLYGVFSTAYKRYKIVLQGYSASSEWLNIRFVSGTTANSTSGYYFAGGYVNTSSMAFQSSGAPATYGRLGYAASDGFITDVDLIGLQETDRYARTSARHGYGTIADTMYGSTFITASAVFDGIEIFHATTQNLNMTTQVYGYR